MITAIMQPYFFPYMGYWQLIQAADCFVLLDDAQYMRHGWVNRNRILKPGGGWQYILVPLRKHGMHEAIRDIQADPEKQWKELIIRQLAHYRKKARYFDETCHVVKDVLFGNAHQGIAAINFSIIKGLCKYLGINTEILVASERNFDYSNVADSGEWALRISEQLAATEYINPAAGAALFNGKKFASSNIRLSFLQSRDIVYPQFESFEPSLSIIDVMMFNGVEGARNFLKHYSVDSGNM